MQHLFSTCLLIGSCVFSLCVSATERSYTVEELRIEKAKMAMPTVLSLLSERVETFAGQIKQAQNLTALTQLVIRHGNGLWKDAVYRFDEANNQDDRPLYWARLQMTKALRDAPAFKKLLKLQQEQLLWKVELLTRGQQDIKFNRKSTKKILITGFDPFFLDRNIKQSNPSGVTALALDDMLLTKDGESAEIEAVIVPVRFEDFDLGMIEELLTPYYRDVDMIVTISMGRKHFDLERFPGLRRSAKAPDNLNVYTGGSKERPVMPLLNDNPVVGPEFVEFSLPVNAMTAATGPFKVNDNRKVTTNKETIAAQSLKSLIGYTSVEGSGGGYLSNEISYRSIILREMHNPLLPVGHIHTPRISGFEPNKSQQIVQQIKQMLTNAISDI